jgi:hypothetical protein
VLIDSRGHGREAKRAIDHHLHQFGAKKIGCAEPEKIERVGFNRSGRQESAQAFCTRDAQRHKAMEGREGSASGICPILKGLFGGPDRDRSEDLFHAITQISDGKALTNRLTRQKPAQSARFATKTRQTFQQRVTRLIVWHQPTFLDHASEQLCTRLPRAAAWLSLIWPDGGFRCAIAPLAA